MTRRETIEAFLSQKVLALAGASRSGRKFGNVVLRELKAKGYEVRVVHPEAAEIDGVPCFSSLAALPSGIGGLVLVVPPAQAAQLVQEAAEAGIPRIWMQQGSSSPEALRTCEEQGLSVIHGECILMFAQPTAGVPRLHRWLWGVLGRLPRPTPDFPKAES